MRRASVTIVLLVCFASHPARAQEAVQLEAEVRKLRSKVSELEASRDAALQQMQELRGIVDGMQQQLQGVAPQGQAEAAPPAAEPGPEPDEAAPTEIAREDRPDGSGGPGKIGEEKEEERRGFQAERAILERQGAVIVPAGQLVLEPGFQYQNSSSNLLNLSGVQFLGAILIGRVDVASIDRDSYTPSIEVRYGLHERLELQTTIPYVFRTDTFLRDLGSEDERVTETNANGIGDVQFGAFGQLLYQDKWWPSVVANVQAVAPTGKDPFEIDDDELPLGLGAWAVSGGLTMVRTLDPAVLFAGVRYLSTIEEEFDGVGDIDFGDAFEYSAGLAFALNERLAMNLSMSHSFTGETRVNGEDIDGSRLNSARLFLGASYRMSNLITANLAFGIGLTEDAPDYTIELSFPLRFSKRLPHL